MQGRRESRRGGLYVRGALTVIAGALVALAFSVGDGMTSEAEAGRSRNRETVGGFVNPADQRNQMIAELKRLNERIGGLEKKLKDGPLEVIVVEMPQQQGD